MLINIITCYFCSCFLVLCIIGISVCLQYKLSILFFFVGTLMSEFFYSCIANEVKEILHSFLLEIPIRYLLSSINCDLPFLNFITQSSAFRITYILIDSTFLFYPIRFLKIIPFIFEVFWIISFVSCVISYSVVDVIQVVQCSIIERV